jgi:hypothetical protein
MELGFEKDNLEQELDEKSLIRQLKELPPSKIEWMTEQLLKDALLSDITKDKLEEMTPHDVQVQLI